MATAGLGRHGPKTRTGCVTCKRRRVKCSLEKPSCSRCAKAGRVCEGYQLSVVQEVVASPAKATTPPHLNNSSSLLSAFRATPSEWQAYGFYSHRIASTLGGAFDTELWQKLMLQAADTEPTVRNGIFALGNLFRHGQDGGAQHASDCVCAHCRQALRYYNKSIVALSDSLQEPSTPQAAHVALLSCIIFICLEFYRMNDNTGISLISKGCSMVAETLNNQSASGTVSIDPSLVKAFDRLWLLAKMFGRQLPRPSSQQSLISGSFWLPDFDSIEGARDCLHKILERVQGLRVEVFRVYSSPSPIHGSAAKASLESEQRAAQILLENWRRNWEKVSAQPAMSATQHPQAHLILRAHYLITKVGACARLDPARLNHEDHLDDFRGIVLAAEEGLTRFPLRDEATGFSFEMSFLAPLYLTALKCRDPTVRRKALEMMFLTGAKEGLWYRSELTCIAARVIELEEGLVAGLGERDGGFARDVAGKHFFDVHAGLNYRRDGRTFVDVAYLVYDAACPERWRSWRETLAVGE
ncbi:hypothetical protein Z517_07963 [Fonsecaea pedrosoi CBS 271.37]|uniref:Zn(2)-C6 fungal-type domain-containing protein n=1 Tax=Fonsecaea pedrosoi CBS 271.37 TaxID=1442368 RepID=A0A0D2GHS6_9EURO|nr:uncharacterized protein Z517_07963 [Fonsecaea pedrosoi CBS 271.37]KIW78130.1 hypothetical protein Z517_07963 [Fonsecaea pedrosoi CBS 271.37]